MTKPIDPFSIPGASLPQLDDIPTPSERGTGTGTTNAAAPSQGMPLPPRAQVPAAHSTEVVAQSLTPGQQSQNRTTELVKIAKARYVEWARSKLEQAASQDQLGYQARVLSQEEQARLPGSEEDPTTLLGRVHAYRQTLPPRKRLTVEAMVAYLEGAVRALPADDADSLPPEIRKLYDDFETVQRAKADYVVWARKQIRLLAGNSTLAAGERQHLPPALRALAESLLPRNMDGSPRLSASLSTQKLIDAVGAKLARDPAAEVAALPREVEALTTQRAAVREAIALFHTRLEQSWMPAIEAAAKNGTLSTRERSTLPPQLRALVGLVTSGSIQVADLKSELERRQADVDPGNLATLTPELAQLYLEVRGFEPARAGGDAAAAAIDEAKEMFVAGVASAVYGVAARRSRLTATDVERLGPIGRGIVEAYRREHGTDARDSLPTRGLLEFVRTEVEAIDTQDATQLPLYLVPYFEQVAPAVEYTPPAPISQLPEQLEWLAAELEDAAGDNQLLSKREQAKLPAAVQLIVESYRQSAPGHRVNTQHLLAHLSGRLDESDLVERLEAAKTAAERGADSRLKPYLDLASERVTTAAGSDGQLSVNEQETNLPDELRGLVESYRATLPRYSRVTVAEFLAYLAEKGDTLGLESRLQPLLEADNVPPASIDEVLAVGSGEYVPLIRALLEAADRDGDGITVKELDAYLANPDPLDLRFLSSGTLATLFPGLLEMQTPARLTKASALGWDMNIRRPIADIKEPWQKELALKADGQGPKGVVNQILTLHELKAALSDVQDGFLTLDEKGLRLEGSGKSAKGWKTEAQWPTGRIWWLPEQFLDMVRLRVAVASKESHPLIPSQTGASKDRTNLAHGYMYVCHNNEYRVPAFVSFAWRSVDVHLRPFVPRKDAFREDPYLPEDARAYPADYYKSGDDIGHNKPSAAGADFLSQWETFFLSNMSPQPGKNNRTTWQDTELAAKEIAKAGAFDMTYFVGNAFLKDVDGELVPMTEAEVNDRVRWIGRDSTRPGGKPSKSAAEKPRVAEPTHLWLVRYVQSAEDPGEVHAEAWLIPNVDAAVPASSGLPGLVRGDEDEAKMLKISRVSVDRIEELFGLDFMAHLPDTVEQKIESADNTMLAPPKDLTLKALDAMRSSGSIPEEVRGWLPEGMPIETVIAGVESGEVELPPAFTVWLWQNLGYKNIPLVYGYNEPEQAQAADIETVGVLQ